MYIADSILNGPRCRFSENGVSCQLDLCKLSNCQFILIISDQMCLSSLQAGQEDLESYNRAAVKEWTEVTLAQCGHCGRWGLVEEEGKEGRRIKIAGKEIKSRHWSKELVFIPGVLFPSPWWNTRSGVQRTDLWTGAVRAGLRGVLGGVVLNIGRIY